MLYALQANPLLNCYIFKDKLYAWNYLAWWKKKKMITKLWLKCHHFQYFKLEDTKAAEVYEKLLADPKTEKSPELFTNVTASLVRSSNPQRGIQIFEQYRVLTTLYNNLMNLIVSLTMALYLAISSRRSRIYLQHSLLSHWSRQLGCCYTTVEVCWDSVCRKYETRRRYRTGNCRWSVCNSRTVCIRSSNARKAQWSNWNLREYTFGKVLTSLLTGFAPN